MSYVQDGPVGRMVAHRGVYLSSSHEACGDQVKHPADGTESEALQNRFAHSGYLCHECVCARANRVGPAGMDQRPIRTATAGVSGSSAPPQSAITRADVSIAVVIAKETPFENAR